MQANELKIGNWVYEVNENSKGTIAAILQNERDIFDVEMLNKDGMFFEVQLEDIKPIPLTEEWLVKLGFKLKDGQDDDKDSTMYHRNMICDIEYGDGSVFWHDNYTSIYHKSITYVHDLQNLYHAIMGEELKIKQEVI